MESVNLCPTSALRKINSCAPDPSLNVRCDVIRKLKKLQDTHSDTSVYIATMHHPPHGPLLQYPPLGKKQQSCKYWLVWKGERMKEKCTLPHVTKHHNSHEFNSSLIFDVWLHHATTVDRANNYSPGSSRPKHQRQSSRHWTAVCYTCTVCTWMEGVDCHT